MASTVPAVCRFGNREPADLCSQRSMCSTSAFGRVAYSSSLQGFTSRSPRGNVRASYSSSAITTDKTGFAPTAGNGFAGMGSSLDFSAAGEVGLLDEVELRFTFLEFIMERARCADAQGVEQAMSEMRTAGLKPGPRAYHGLVVAYARSGDTDGALQALRREFGSGETPLAETFISLARLFGSKKQAQRGEEILAAMEQLDQDPRLAWIALVEELFKAGLLDQATEIFFKGAKEGMRPTNNLDDMLVEENCRVGQHGNAVDIIKLMEFRGRKTTTFHVNCLLMAQANADVPDIAAMTFENMQYGHDGVRPDTESYNWVIQAHTRYKLGDRCKEVIDVLGEMVEDHKRVMPNMRTYALLVECFTKWNLVGEAIRHFRALVHHPAGTVFLHNEGKHGDPLSLYLRGICLEGRVVELLLALEAMVKDKQPLPPRAMFVNRKGRTLVSSWIEPMDHEPDLGFEVDYVARYIAEGGETGTRNRWRSQGGRFIDPDSEGFAYSKPMERSFKHHCLEMRRSYNLKLLKKLRIQGVSALGAGATEDDLIRVIDRLKKETFGESFSHLRKPKAASKMLVSELKEELEAQGLPTDGTRPVLYQRVQKARRINRARGRPLWLPPAEYLVQEVDEELDNFRSQLNLKDENTENWRKRFLAMCSPESVEGEQQPTEEEQPAKLNVTGGSVLQDEIETDDVAEVDDEEENDEEVEVDDFVEDGVEDGAEDDEPDEADEPDGPPEMLAVKLFKTSPELLASQKVGRRGGQWLGLTAEEKFAKLRSEKLFEVTDLYTIADVWGWTWERQLLESEPERWSQEREVELGMQILQKVIDLGGVPTIGDCAMLIRAAIRTPWPEAIISLLQQSYKLGYVFGNNLYEEAVTLCLSLGERDAAVAIVADMEDAGITAPADLLGRILAAPADELGEILDTTTTESLQDDVE